MLARPNILSIITMHTCSAACEHCCFTCSPKVKDSIPVDRIHLYIDQAMEVESIRVVVFTGGECFLLGAKLDDLVHHANDNGFSTRFVSNGYWATSPANARKRVDKLVAAGLREANFSTGDMHAEYVKPAFVRNGAIACAEAGIPTIVMVEMFKQTGFSMDEFVSEPQFKKMLDNGKILLNPSPWMKFNGEAEVGYSTEFSDMRNSKMTPCESLFGTIAIKPSEHLVACCGLTLEQIEELHLGSLKQHSIKEILTSTPDDFIKIWVHVQGPLAVMRYANSIDPSIPIPHELVHICDHCRSMYHDKRVSQVIKDNPPPDMNDIITRFMEETLIKTISQVSNPNWDKVHRNRLYEQRSKVWTEDNARKFLEIVKS